MSIVKTTALALLLLGSVPLIGEPTNAQSLAVVSVAVAPPPLPIYAQPPVPGIGYLWSPGYWEWDQAFGYFWVPGTWVLPPRPNLLWTPAYWGWDDGFYVFHRGYWGTQVGFYGGVIYGFGYTGVGFQGGYWNNGAFFYNRAVTNITNVSVTNVYNQTVVVNSANTNVSYNGGVGGTTARPTPQQTALGQQTHDPPTSAQTQQASLARANPALRVSANHGAPPIAATPLPHAFSGPGLIGATQSGRSPPTGSPAVRQPASANPANALPTGSALPPHTAESVGSPRPTSAQPTRTQLPRAVAQAPVRMPQPGPATTPPSGTIHQPAFSSSTQHAQASQRFASPMPVRQQPRPQSAQQQPLFAPARQAPVPRMARPPQQRSISRPAPHHGRR